MRKITIKEIIRFRSKSEYGKQKFATEIKLPKAKPTSSSGGDYWTSAVSAIAKAYRYSDLDIIGDKIKEIAAKLPATKKPGTKAQYNSNIELLEKYQSFDFRQWRSASKFTTLKNSKLALNIKDLSVESSPQFVYVFGKEDHKQVGATWMIAQKDGFRQEELGMFTDILYRYLKDQFGKTYILNPTNCVAVDLVGNYSLDYAELKEGSIPLLLNKTVDEIKRYM